MGNICRSPTAEAVFRRAVQDAGFDGIILCDSAGTHDYHIGDPPDPHSIAAAARRGYNMTALRARRIGAADFHRFDHILAMDHHNLLFLQKRRPAQSPAKMQLFGDLHADFAGQDVPDPYYGGAAGFERVLTWPRR